MAVELPTAFPYFAAIAAIVGSGLGPARQLVLLLVFNVCFVLPLVGIVATLHLGGPGAEERLARVRLFMHRHWPIVFASVALIAGTIVIVLGLSGLAHRHSHLGRLLRHIGHFLPEPLR
jgi:cytochrome c biogenesis protein CcdA